MPSENKIVDNFISKERAQQIIAQASDRVTPMTQKWGDCIRNCEMTTYRKDEFGVVPAIHALRNVGPIEGYQVARYSQGQFYPAHMDENSNTPREKWRHTTAVIYLNKPTRGGATFFPDSGVRVHPQIGRLLLFNTIEDGKINPVSLHTSEEVLEGEKWTLTIWFMERTINTVN